MTWWQPGRYRVATWPLPAALAQLEVKGSQRQFRQQGAREWLRYFERVHVEVHLQPKTCHLPPPQTCVPLRENYRWLSSKETYNWLRKADTMMGRRTATLLSLGKQEFCTAMLSRPDEKEGEDSVINKQCVDKLSADWRNMKATVPGFRNLALESYRILAVRLFFMLSWVLTSHVKGSTQLTIFSKQLLNWVHTLNVNFSTHINC